MINKFVLLLVIVGFVGFLGVARSASADHEVEIVPATQSGEMVEVNSYELFWPIVAGRTMGDRLYFVKNLKEGVRGMVIFGKAQKAEYQVFLATKRVLEAEKLLNAGKREFASKTLDRAYSLLDKASVNAGSASSKDAVVDIINIRLDNLEKFLPALVDKNEESRDKIEPVLERVKDLNQNI